MSLCERILGSDKTRKLCVKWSIPLVCLLTELFVADHFVVHSIASVAALIVT